MKIPYEVKVAGHAHGLSVVSIDTGRGSIPRGVAFAFEGQGCWVVDSKDLLKIAQASLRAQAKRKRK